MIPRMKTRIERDLLFDTLYLEWGDLRLMTTAKPGAFSSKRIREEKRKFARISRKDAP
jgi:hypothetical protein